MYSKVDDNKIIQIAAVGGELYGLSENGNLYKMTSHMGDEWRLIIKSDNKYEDVGL